MLTKWIKFDLDENWTVDCFYCVIPTEADEINVKTTFILALFKSWGHLLFGPSNNVDVGL